MASSVPIPPYPSATSGAPRPATAPRDPALEAQELVRVFGGRRAVNGISVTLAQGDCLALFGPNGAGKTTLLRLLGGLLTPNSGRTQLQGVTLPGPAATRRLVGLISHHAMLYPALTVRENVRFAAECQGVLDADGATTRALTRLRVIERADMPVRALSRGLQQRVSIARALVHGPRLVLLDEPYTGLDDVGARALTDALRDLREQGAVLVLTTHHLHEGLALATASAIMIGGRLVHTERAGAGDLDVRGYQERYRRLVQESHG